jgi:hypothetical protein
MQIINFAQLRYWHCIKLYKFLVHLNSDDGFLWDCFHLKNLLIHVTALLQFLIFYSLVTHCWELSRQKLNCFIELSDIESVHSWLCECSGYWCFKYNEPPPLFIVFCTEVISVYVISQRNISIAQLVLSLQFQIKLLVC